MIGYFTIHRKRYEDVKKEAVNDTVISEEIYIGSGVDLICVDMKVSECRITEVSEQFIRIDKGAKSAHKRIFGIEKECAKKWNTQTYY